MRELQSQIAPVTSITKSVSFSNRRLIPPIPDTTGVAWPLGVPLILRCAHRPFHSLLLRILRQAESHLRAWLSTASRASVQSLRSQLLRTFKSFSLHYRVFKV